MFTNTDNVIDSRDIIERIEELEALIADNEATQGDISEFETLTILQKECEEYSSDWSYGESLIRRSYFEQYMDEIVEDCYELPKDLPYWMTIKLDYDALEQDYISVDFDGVEYLIRSC